MRLKTPLIKKDGKFSKTWGCELTDRPGMTITDIIAAIDKGKIRAMYIIGENPKLSDPDWNHLNWDMQYPILLPRKFLMK